MVKKIKYVNPIAVGYAKGKDGARSISIRLSANDFEQVRQLALLDRVSYAEAARRVIARGLKVPT